MSDEYGEQLKLEGMQRAADAVPEWSDTAWVVLLGLAASGEPFTSEDLVKHVGLPRGEVGTNRNNAVGALFSRAARTKVIYRVGQQNARRSALHAASLAVWKGVGK